MAISSVASVRRRSCSGQAPHGMQVNQDDVIAWLSSPESYRGSEDSDAALDHVERIDTHASVIFLAGSRAFKLKRAVRYEYLDYSTVERRRVCCTDEVRLNRRTAPKLYRGVRAVTVRTGRGFELDGPGEVVDWLVEMNRFDPASQLDRLAERGALDLELMPRLADAIAHLHEVAEWRFDQGGLDGLSWVIDGNRADIQRYGHGFLDDAECERLSAGSRSLMRQHGERLEARRLAGFVRHCHGDLHLGNVCLVDGQPTLFDGVEFNAAIACVDVMYDLAFVLMDLLHRQLDRHANEVLNRYVEQTSDLGGLRLLPLFLAVRAGVRAKTSATAAPMQPDAVQGTALRHAAQQYVSLAADLLSTRPARLVVVGGGSGTGKTTLARGLAPSLGPQPGALVLRSDVERKRLLGVPLHTRLGASGYTQTVSRAVYRRLAEQASLILQEGHGVIVDAVCGDPMERAMLADVARSQRVPFTGLWLEAPLTTLAARLEARTGDASDATPRVAARQLERNTAPTSWTRLDATTDAPSVLRDAQLELAGAS